MSQPNYIMFQEFFEGSDTVRQYRVMLDDEANAERVEKMCQQHCFIHLTDSDYCDIVINKKQMSDVWGEHAERAG